jgi:2-keto-4-pentenoate hydratase/2-oxohepta-3-ene-1,7-dioic acid hydratase in catechol pathway
MNRLVRFRHISQDHIFWGRRDGSRVRVLSHAPWNTESQETSLELPFNEAVLLAPVEPTKIVALGYNYKDMFSINSNPDGITHYSDPDFEPVVFLKGPNAIAAPGAAITLSPRLGEVWAEVELAIVVGKKIRNCRDKREAKEAIFGFTIGNDITTLNVFERDWHLARSKSLDGFCPLGPELISEIDVESRNMRARINGVMNQSSNTENRILNSVETVRFVSGLMTLEPGDVILTGTPPGARGISVKPGDQVEVEIDGLGVLKSRCVPVDFSPHT